MGRAGKRPEDPWTQAEMEEQKVTRLIGMPSSGTTCGLTMRKVVETISPVVDRVSGADVKELRRNVLNHCLGDELRAKRCVEYEHWLAPRISKREALRRALEGLRQSNTLCAMPSRDLHA